MLMNQDVVVLLTTYGKSYILQTYMIANGQQNNMKAFAHLPAKTRLPKQDHLESSVSLLDINLDGFSSAKLFEQ